MSAPLAITAVRTWRCRFPLPAPFRIGRQTIAEREYLLVRVETAGGLHGSAFALTRGAPVDAVIADLVAPLALGCDARRTRALHAAWDAGLVHHAPEGLVLRARSLLDVAAWDLKGQAAGEPVWRLLGGARETAPAMLVEGYPSTGEDDAGFAARVAAAGRGFAAVKVAHLADEPERVTRRLELLRETAGPALGITLDVGFVWSDHRAAVALAERWRDLDLTWIEDPLPGHRAEAIARLRRAVATPVAVGDEVTSARDLRALADLGAVDVLRLDATCAGGVSGLVELWRHARSAGVEVSTHVYPEIHRHVVCGLPDSGPLELFRPDAPWDATAQFVEPVALAADASGGVVAQAPAEPGLGLRIDWERVERASVRTLVTT